MALPASGPLSASQINVELGRAVGAAFSMNDAAVRSLAGKPSGPISFSDLLGKSARTYVYDANLAVGASTSIAGATGYFYGEGGNLTPRAINVAGLLINFNIFGDYGAGSSWSLVLDYSSVPTAQQQAKIDWLNANANCLEIDGQFNSNIGWSIDAKLLIVYGFSTGGGGVVTNRVGQTVTARLYKG